MNGKTIFKSVLRVDTLKNRDRRLHNLFDSASQYLVVFALREDEN